LTENKLKIIHIIFGSVDYYSYICLVGLATGRYGNIERVDSNAYIHERPQK